MTAPEAIEIRLSPKQVARLNAYRNGLKIIQRDMAAIEAARSNLDPYLLEDLGQMVESLDNPIAGYSAICDRLSKRSRVEMQWDPQRPYRISRTWYDGRIGVGQRAFERIMNLVFEGDQSKVIRYGARFRENNLPITGLSPQTTPIALVVDKSD